MEVSCPECGVLFIPSDDENPVVCPVCEWEFDVMGDVDWDELFDELTEED